MATMITNECINCGACEPECPNNAITQGETIFVIDPQLCTECVGFHDYEACAAVCPVDCCVTDPNNVESEEALIARARAIHPETDFGESFESRFRKGEGNGGVKPAPKEVAGKAAPQDAKPTTAAAHEATAAPAATPAEPEVQFVALPAVESWDIPIRCLKCNETHTEPVSNFMIGNVIFCPHCHRSMVVRDNLNFHIRTLMRDAYEKWQREQEEFLKHRERELAEFIERRSKDTEAFKNHQKTALARIRQQLDAIGESYDAPGRPVKKGARFAWG